MINFGCTDNYEQSYENENGSPHRRGESAFTWTRKGKREKEKKGEKNRFASKELKIVLARLDPGPDPALDWVLLPREDGNVVIGHSSKFTLNRFPSLEEEEEKEEEAGLLEWGWRERERKREKEKEKERDSGSGRGRDSVNL